MSIAAGMSAKREVGVTPLVRPFKLLAVPFLATVAAMSTVEERDGEVGVESWVRTCRDRVQGISESLNED
jgi:hypothetical protein